MNCLSLLMQSEAFDDLTIAGQTGGWGLVYAVLGIVFLAAGIIGTAACMLSSMISRKLGDDER